MSVHIIQVKTPYQMESTVSQLQKPIASLFSHQGILDILEIMCVSTYEKFEMDADWWKNDAAKVNEIKSAVVKHELGSYYGGKNSNENLRWS